MKFVNKTKNTIFLEDVNLNIPYLENNKEQEIDIDIAKKSICFRNLVIYKNIQITEVGDSIFEKSLLKLNKIMEEKMPIKSKTNNIPETNDLEVKITGHFYDAGGYSKVNRNMAIGLSNLGARVSIEPVSNSINDLSQEELNQLLKFKRGISKNAISIDSVIPSFSDFSSGKYKILYTTLESTTIPNQFLQTLNNYHEIWVTSDFCKKVLLEHGITKRIEVMPNSFDINLYTQNKEKHEFNPPLKKYVFGSLFGWSYRKGYDALIKSYLKEFNGDDDVSLLIVSRFQSRSDRSNIIKEEINDLIKKHGGSNPAHIARCSKVIPEKELPKIYKSMDCFVLPSRGEGFGMIYAEASLCSVPVISTNWGGQTMFLNTGNSYLVDIDKLEKIETGQMKVHYWDGQIFPKLTSNEFVSDLGKTMRHVYLNKEEALNKNIQLKSFISENYNIDVISKKINNRLLEIKGSL
jgi:glycosyltransferase involved in cell wall biosynthesis